MSPVINPHERQHAKAADFRQRLAKALGTPTPLDGIAASGLERAVAHFRLSPDPDAWIWATLCGAELQRRDAKITRPHTTGLTAAEIAWEEQKQRRKTA